MTVGATTGELPAPVAKARVPDVFEPLAQVLRTYPGDPNGHLETLHHGAICIMSGTGEELHAIGNTNVPIPLRSTAKPFQLLPYLLDGLHLAGRGGTTTLDELAVMMSSHNGEDTHTSRVARILTRAGLQASALQCGTHPPLDDVTRARMERSGEEPNALHCNCSGKHANMLLVCLHNKWPLESYLRVEHPLQVRIREIIAMLTGVLPHRIEFALDGCSLPTAVIPLKALARAYTYLAVPALAPRMNGRQLDDVLQILFQAGTAFPELIAGNGRLDTELMKAFPSAMFAKTGAAGVYAMAIKPTPRFQNGLAIAFKIADGDAHSRVRRVVAADILRQLHFCKVNASVDDCLQRVADSTQRNFRGLDVGRLETTFTLA